VDCSTSSERLLRNRSEPGRVADLLSQLARLWGRLKPDLVQREFPLFYRSAGITSALVETAIQVTRPEATWIAVEAMQLVQQAVETVIGRVEGEIADAPEARSGAAVGSGQAAPSIAAPAPSSDVTTSRVRVPPRVWFFFGVAAGLASPGTGGSCARSRGAS
jgi:hypothetical protein